MPRDDRWEELSLSTLSDDDEKEDVGIGLAHGRRSFSYYRMPEPLIKLSVLKLDGSFFDVQVERAATVQELKLAVENVFNHPPKEEGVQISWSHLWSQFCLCYKSVKLTDERACLRSLRVKDGDQLCFIRHLSFSSIPTKRKPTSYGTVTEKHRRSFTAPEVLEKIEENGMEKNVTKVNPSTYEDEENENLVGHKECRLSHFLLRFFSCIGLLSSGRTKLDGRTRSSRLVAAPEEL